MKIISFNVSTGKRSVSSVPDMVNTEKKVTPFSAFRGTNDSHCTPLYRKGGRENSPSGEESSDEEGGPREGNLPQPIATRACGPLTLSEITAPCHEEDGSQALPHHDRARALYSTLPSKLHKKAVGGNG